MAYDADTEKGRFALREFHNYCVARFSNYKFSFEELVSKASEKNKFLCEGLGLAINQIEMPDSRVSRAMRALADKGGGRLPVSWNGWFTAIKDEGAKIDFVDAAVYVAAESAVDFANGAAEIGEAVVTTGRSLLAVAPMAILAAALFILYRKASSV